MGVYTEAVQKLYVAYFSRPADTAGLTYWENVVAAANGDTSAVSAAFAASQEYKDTFEGQSAYQVINTIYMNLFGRPAEAAALTFWGQGLLNGNFTIDNAVTAIASGAQGTDLAAYDSKVSAATSFTAALDTSAEILGYNGERANAAAKTWLADVTDADTLATAIAPTALNATVASVTAPFVAPMNVTLTAGVDTFTGGAGNDVITATTATGAQGLTTFDVIDAGAGIDTIRFVDTATLATDPFALPTTASVSNVEVVNVATTGGLALDTTTWTGVTAVNATASGTAAVNVDAAGTTDVTVGSATTGITDIDGGRAVKVALTAATAGDVSVTGAALTDVTVQGGAVATVDNTSATGTTAAGKTLTNVTLDGVNGATAALSGAALTNVSLKNIDQATAVTVTNATAGHALNLSVDKVGYDATGAAVAVSVADAAATTVNVAANGKSNVAVSAGAAKTVNVTGSAALALDLAAVAAATSINASAASGGVTLTGIDDGVTSIVTGSGADKFTVTANTIKNDPNTSADETKNATVDSGAGNDDITVATTGNGMVTVMAGAGDDKVTIASRGTEVLNIDLGDGNDTLNATAAITATDVINAGAGTDTLLLKLVGSANVGAFRNFDVYDVKSMATNLDLDILNANNVVTEIVASGALAGAVTLQNIAAGVNFRATADMDATALTLSQKAGGALTVTIDADQAAEADGDDVADMSVVTMNATSVNAVFDTSFANAAGSKTGEAAATDNVATINLDTRTATSVSVVSGGTNAKNVLNLTDGATTDVLASVVVTGSQNLTLTTASATKLSTIDASAATGGLTTSLENVSNGGTIKLGSGTDIITVTTASSATTSTSAIGAENIAGFAKAAAVAVSTELGDATAKAAAIAAADKLMLGNVTTGDEMVADANAAASGASLAKGVLTFTGAGPATLENAIVIADAFANTVGETVAFAYLGNTYVFTQGSTHDNGAVTAAAVSTADVLVKLVGVTGVTEIVEAGTDGFFLV